MTVVKILGAAVAALIAGGGVALAAVVFLARRMFGAGWVTEGEEDGW